MKPSKNTPEIVNRKTGTINLCHALENAKELPPWTLYPHGSECFHLAVMEDFFKVTWKQGWYKTLCNQRHQSFIKENMGDNYSTLSRFCPSPATELDG